MPYTIPTSAELKAAFPPFQAVDDAIVTQWIGRAARSVDTSWPELDYQFGIELLACHYLVLNGYGTGAEAKVNANGMSGFATIRSGQLTLQRNASSHNSDVPAPWAGTQYGVQFYWLARRARPAVAVVVGPIDCYPPGYYPGVLP